MRHSYFYDWLEDRWLRIERDRQLSECDRALIKRRQTLIDQLITEIKEGDSVTGLYAGLLARTLAASDKLLLRKYGKPIAELGGKLPALFV